MNTLPATLPVYRVKEFNSAYDTYFGYGKGWIYATNITHSYFKALGEWLLLTTLRPGFKYTIDIL